MFESFTENQQDAVVILKKDHAKVKDLFDQFEETEQRAQKIRIAAMVIKELKAHAAVEEEIFYPTVRATVGDKIMNEALEEHHVAKMLIAELEKMTGVEDQFDAKFTVLAENIRHHIEEEEDDMLPRAREADIDFEELGEALLARKQELMQKGFPVLPEERLVGVRKGGPLNPGKTAVPSRSKKRSPTRSRAGKKDDTRSERPIA